MIYLDNAATTYPKPGEVYQAMDDTNRNSAFNAGRGSYRVAKEASKLIDETKKKICELIHAPAGAYVTFTPSITIALNEILQGIEYSQGAHVYISPYEHNAVARVLALLADKYGIDIVIMPLKEDCLEIDLEKLKYMFTKNRPYMVCCNHMSNVTGYVLPVKDIFTMAKGYGAVTVLDTAQSLGVIPVNLTEIEADFVAFAGHKSLYGPLGIGGFVGTSQKNSLNVVIAGGTGSNSLSLSMPKTMPEKYESSSTNIVAISGLHAALSVLDVNGNYEHEKNLTTKLVEGLSKLPGVIIYGNQDDNYVGVVSFNISGYLAEDIGTILDEEYDIAVRTGYHCAPYIHKYLANEEYVGTVRVGIGKFTTEKDIDTLIDALASL